MTHPLPHMNRLILPLYCLLLLAMSCQAPTPNPYLNAVPLDSEQLILVRAEGHSAVGATLQRYEKQNGQWQAVGGPWPVVVGKKGLSWGASLQDKIPAGATRKQEGDSRAPIGIYRLGRVFGYAEQAPDVFMPYLAVTPDWLCVDDARSRYYNAVLDSAKVPESDWQSAEHMLREDSLYRWGITVEYNTSPTVPGEGSCIFLHLWKGTGEGTEGCTAMAESDLLTLIHWLEQSKNPLLVQGSSEDLEFLKTCFQLP
jgi:L,D-peptidoglycan transpeptidase YkuD (ErfK/YbiS/YcfS/YnhG family)